MRPASPVLPSRPDLVASEVLIGKGQDQYIPLPALVSDTSHLAKDAPIVQPIVALQASTELDGLGPSIIMISRFEISDEDLCNIVRTRSIWLSQIVVGKYAPVMIETEEPISQ